MRIKFYSFRAQTSEGKTVRYTHSLMILPKLEIHFLDKIESVCLGWLFWEIKINF